jgi:hypothetical protein
VLQLNCYCCHHLPDQIKNYEIGPLGVEGLVRMGGGIRNVPSGPLWRNVKDRGHFEDLGVDGRIILK